MNSEDQMGNTAESMFEVGSPLADQQLVSGGGFIIRTLAAVGGAMEAVSKLVQSHDPESSLKRIAPKTQKRMEREMAAPDPELRRIAMENAMRGPGMISPMRAYRAKKRNDRMVREISAMDPALEPALKTGGAKVIFDSEYSQILKFLTADYQDRQNMDVSSMGISNPAVRAQLEWMQTYPHLADDIKSSDVVEMISNLRQQMGNRGEFLQKAHLRIGGKASRKGFAADDGDLGVSAAPRPAYGAVGMVRRESRYDHDRRPRP